MDETPAWIELLYRRLNPYHALVSAFVVDLTQSQLAQAAESNEQGRDKLRQVALAELLNNDSDTVALSLVFLAVVGTSNDLPAVTEFAAHPSDVVRRAANYCLYALRRQS